MKYKNLISKMIICLYLILTITFISCNTKSEPKLEKPFIVIKIGWGNNNNKTYTYQDKNGNRETFYTKEYSYCVGDTLK